LPSWDELFKEETFVWKEPDEWVTWLVSMLRDRNFRHVYDHGCGAGRHLVYLAREGFETYGSDISDNALKRAEEWLTREGLHAEVKKSDMTIIPYPDEFFGGVVSAYVIQHNTRANMQKAINEIYRVLRPGGLLYITFISTGSHRCGNGVMIEPNTFIPDTGEDRGVPHHFCDRADVEDLLKQFHMIKIELNEKKDERWIHHSHWLVMAENLLEDLL
jgi:ubiquinone/menaquinone biosynthesis C-methylase UbiE